MKVLISEKLSEHKYKTPEGYLICTDAILARTGKQSYTKDELFQDGDNTEVNVDRPYDEVMNAKTIASFENKPITFDHPDEDVNVGNYKDYAIGYVRDVRQGKTDKGEDVILGNLVITDQDAINAIEQGDHTDLSCGYDCDIRDDGSGNYSQTNIRGNHLALCEQGRAGIARIVDSKMNDKLSYEAASSDDNYLDEVEKMIYKFANVRVDAMLVGDKLKIAARNSKGFNSKQLNDIASVLMKNVAVSNITISNPDRFDSNVTARIVDSKARDSKIEGVPPELLLNLNDWFSDKVYIERKYHVKIYNIISNEGLTVSGSRQDLEKLYKDYHLENGYHLKIVDSKVEDAAIGGHYKNNSGENFFICSYGSGFSIFKADGEYLDGSKHLSLDGVKQRILYYNLTKVKDSAKDSIMKDESEDWTEMLIKLAVKNGKNSSGDYEYDGDADVNQVRRVLKKLGYKDNGYVKNPKSYLHKLHYYFTDSKVEDSLSKKEKELCDYMLENALDDGEDENDLLKKMKLYYSEYSNLARSKPNEVLRYFKSHIDNEIEDASWKTTKMASGIIHELGNMRIIEEENEKGDIQYRIGGTNGQVFSSLEKAKNAIRRKHLDEIEDAGWKTTKMASGIIHELGNMRIIEEENEKGDIQYRIGGTNGQVFSSLEKAKNAIRRKHLDEIEDAGWKTTKDSKEMTMSDAIKMLNIVDIYKKVKDSYIVVRNKSKYEEAARKLGLTIEKDNKSLRIYGDKYKLKQLQNQFDNDEEISYVVAKDSISKVDLKRGIDIAEDKYGYFDFSQLKEEIEKTTKHQFSTRELYEALKQNSLLNAYISRLFGNTKDEDLTKDGKLWQTSTRKAKH